MLLTHFTPLWFILNRLEAFAVVAAYDGFVGVFVVGEAVVGGVPAEFLAEETGSFDGDCVAPPL